MLPSAANCCTLKRQVQDVVLAVSGWRGLGRGGEAESLLIELPAPKNYVGCQNYGPFLGP